MCARRKSEPTSITPDESKKWNDGSGHERPLREILYLDFNRITSYLSQLHNGLVEYFERIESSNRGKKNPTAEAQVGGGAYPVGVKFYRGGTENVDTFTTVQRQILHHAALGAFEEILEQRQIVGSLESGKPFLRHVGHPFLLDYQEIAARQKRANEVATNEINLDDLIDNLGAFGDRLDLFFYDEDVAAPLDRQFMSFPPKLLYFMYGSPFRNKVTVIGLNVASKSPGIDVKDPKEAVGMARFAAFMEDTYNKNLAKLFAFEGARQVIPIALFIDIDSTAI